jgi:hypothetical protein
MATRGEPTAQRRAVRRLEHMARYAAKLLFDWNPDPRTGSRLTRLTEERIVVFAAGSATRAVAKAKRLGRGAELRYESGHQLRFVGILQLMELGMECAAGEVWWEFRRRRRAKERARALLPHEKALWVFTDLTSSKNGSRQRPPSNRREASRLTGHFSRRPSRPRLSG